MPCIGLAVTWYIFSLIISAESPIIPADLRTRGIQEEIEIGDGWGYCAKALKQNLEMLRTNPRGNNSDERIKPY